MSNFIKEFKPNDFKKIEKDIKKYMLSRVWFTLHSPISNPFKSITTYKQIDNVLGLAYTSTGAYAGYWVCNEEVYLDDAKKYSLQGFSIGVSGYTYAIFKELATEKEISFPISAL